LTVFTRREEASVDDLSPVFSGVARDELMFSETFGANMLMIGSDRETRNLIDNNLLHLKQPLNVWNPGERLVLPVAETGTLILHEVGLLPREDQVRLMTWMENAVGRVRVVCTSSESMMPRIEAGSFNQTLYYRLNTVAISVSSSPALSYAPSDLSRDAIS